MRNLRSLAQRLPKIFTVSHTQQTPPGESQKATKQGIIPDDSLIALGANRTIAAPRALVEYAYMYEPQVSPSFYKKTMPALARATAAGIVDYLGNNTKHKKHLVSYPWKTQNPNSAPKNSTLQLQLAMRELGYYGADDDRCDFDGIYGSCTKAAVKKFQRSKKLPATGSLDERTATALAKESKA